MEWAKDRTAALLHHGMGCGKTLTSITLIQRVVEAKASCRVLVCCPKAVIAAWQKQCGLWAPHIRVVALDQGTGKAKEQALRQALSDSSALIVVCNYESAWRIGLFEKTKWDMLVWDEVHRLKSPSGKASRWASRMCTKNPDGKKLGLSGTLIPHSILDAYAVWRSVESPECPTFGTSFVRFRSRYAVLNPHQPGMVLRFQNLDEAHAKIAATTHRAKSSDVLDLPPIQYIDVPCELSPEESRLYDELESDFCASVDDGTITPKNALEHLLRLQQVCGGYVRFDDEPTARKICAVSAKRSALSDMLEDLPVDEPLVVFCRFKSDIEAVRECCAASRRSVSELSGARNELSDWQQSKTTVLVAQIQSGGIGIDLTRASYCAFYSLGYSLSDYEQAVARLHRPGQEKPTIIYHLVATKRHGRKTVDGRVYSALRERKEVISGIIDGYGIERGAGGDSGDRRGARRAGCS